MASVTGAAVSAGVAVVVAAAAGSASRDLAIIIDSARSPHTLTAGIGGVFDCRNRRGCNAKRPSVGTHSYSYATINYPTNSALDWFSTLTGVRALIESV